MAMTIAQDPIIVFGAPRSGTTYVQRMLSAHPDVFISDEIRVFAWLHHALKLTEDHRLLANDGEGIVMRLRAVLPQLIRDFYAGHAPGIRHWGDKNPHYADPFNRGCLELIDELFPASRFIHVIRDGRDVVSSLARKGRDDGEPWVDFESAHAVWSQHVDIGSGFGRALPAERYFEVRYEDLVADDVGYAQQLFRFLKIDYNEAVDRFCREQQVERTPFSGPTRELRAGILGSDWARIFTAEEQARSLELIGQPLVAHGYESCGSLAKLREEIRGRTRRSGTPGAAE